ncbi:MAG: hypothetical protein PVH62_10700 [Anaerolineae bacterium]|jgi:hypothetical protein
MNELLNFYNRRKTQVALALGVALGLLVGLLVGWALWPTSYYNATPSMLRQDFQEDYLAWVAEEFAVNGNLQQVEAQLGVEFWKGDTLSEALNELAQRRGGEEATNLMALAQALEQEPTSAEPAPSRLRRPALLICGLGLAAAALAALAYLGLHRLSAGRAERREVSERAVASRQVEPVDWEEEPAPPIAQFVTSYTLGDDFYDPSFSIENEEGDFMGECGVGISETMGVGEPSKVTALEVWLFDKNDIRTVTKVLMSEYAYQDEALRTKLASKGDLVLVEPGAEIILETATLVLRARLLGLEYGEGRLPPQSFFKRLETELGAWIKMEGEDQAIPEFPTSSVS